METGDVRPAKVDALMALCDDRLEASLTAAARRRLLAEALAPADDREMEAAE